MADELLYTIARSILDKVVEKLQAVPLDIPERRYVHFGLVAEDTGPGMSCENQLVITFLPGDFQGLPGFFDPSPLVCEQPPVAQYQLELTRCQPTMQGKSPPSPTELDDAAKEMLTYAREIWRAVYQAHRDGDLLPGGNCQLLRMGGGNARGPQGGVSTYFMNLEVGLI